MATAIKETSVSTFESAADRVRDLNERIIDSSQKAGTASLEAYARLLERVAEFQEQAGRRGSEWLSAFGHAQATFTRELAEALPAAARDVGQRARDAAGTAHRQTRRVPGAETVEGEIRGAVAKNGGLPIAGDDKLSAKEVEKRRDAPLQARAAQGRHSRAQAQEPRHGPEEDRVAPRVGGGAFRSARGMGSGGSGDGSGVGAGGCGSGPGVGFGPGDGPGGRGSGVGTMWPLPEARIHSPGLVDFLRLLWKIDHTRGILPSPAAVQFHASAERCSQYASGGITRPASPGLEPASSPRRARRGCSPALGGRRAAQHDVDPGLREHGGERDRVRRGAALAAPRAASSARRRGPSAGRWPAPP